MDFYTFEPCPSSNSFEMKFKKRINLDKISFGEILAKTSVIALMNLEGASVSFYASGKVMLKELPLEKAKKLGKKIYNMLIEVDAFEN